MNYESQGRQYSSTSEGDIVYVGGCYEWLADIACEGVRLCGVLILGAVAVGCFAYGLHAGGWL